MSDKLTFNSDGTLVGAIAVGAMQTYRSLPVLSYVTASTGGVLHPGEYYYYEVSTVNAYGESFPVAIQPVVPAGTATNTVVLRWEHVIGATGYKVYGRQTGIPKPVTASLVAGGSLDASTTYRYAITATNALGETRASTYASTTTDTTNKTIRLVWSRVTDATGYKVYGRTNTGTVTLLATISSGDIITWDDDGTITPGGTNLPVYNTAWPDRYLMATITSPFILSWTDDGSVTPSGVKNIKDSSSYFCASSNEASTSFGYQTCVYYYTTNSCSLGHQVGACGQNLSLGYRAGSGSSGAEYGSIGGFQIGTQIIPIIGYAIGHKAVGGAGGLSVGYENYAYPTGYSIGHYGVRGGNGVGIGHFTDNNAGVVVGTGAKVYNSSYLTAYYGAALGIGTQTARMLEVARTVDYSSPPKHLYGELSWCGKTDDGSAKRLGIVAAEGNYNVTDITLSTSSTGGSLAPGTYYYRICTYTLWGAASSAEYSIVVPAGTSTNTVTISWTNPTWNSLQGVIEKNLFGRTSGATTLVAASLSNLTSFLDTGAATTPGSLPPEDISGGIAHIRANSAMMFDFECVAQDIANTCFKGWNIRGVITRGATVGSTAISSLTANTWSDGGGGTSGWACTLEADTTNGALRVVVTGQSGTIINWTAGASFTEVVA